MRLTLMLALCGALVFTGCDKKDAGSEAAEGTPAPAAAEAKVDEAAKAAEPADGVKAAADDKAAEPAEVAKKAGEAPAPAAAGDKPVVPPKATKEPAEGETGAAETAAEGTEEKPKVNVDMGNQGSSVDPATMAAIERALMASPNAIRAKKMIDDMATNMQKMLQEINAADGDQDKIKKINEKFKILNEKVSKEGEKITDLLTDQEKQLTEAYAQAKISPLVGQLLQAMLSSGMAGTGTKPTGDKPAGEGDGAKAAPAAPAAPAEPKPANSLAK